MNSAIHLVFEVLKGVVGGNVPAPAVPLPVFAVLNFFIGLASLCISILLVLFVVKRQERTFNWLFLWFATRIAAVGAANLLDAFSVRLPISEAFFAARAVLALVSITTAALLIRALPKLVALPNQSELSKENRELRRDIIESERRFSEVADTAPARIWMTGVNGLLIYCNTQTEEFYGVPRSELLGLSAPPRVHPEDFEPCFKQWLDCFRKRLPIQVEFRQLRADGEWRWTNAHVVPRFAPDGAFLGYIGLMVDVTERRATEGELTKAKRAAEEASRAKDDFIAALSHELRTPLTPVLMIATMLAEDPELTPEARAQAHVLLQNAEVEVRLIDDLLDVTKFTRGKFSIRPEKVSVDELLRDALETVREGILEKQIEVHLDIALKSGVLMADPVRLRQVFWNLLKNAIKFTPERGRIDVHAFNPDLERITVEVRDTGVGLAPEMLQKIFAPFEQGAAAGKAKFGGLGLGLAISKAIVELHGGSIRATSAGLDSGAMFSVTIPVGKPEEAFQRKAGCEPVGPHAPLHILLVEDNTDTREVLARLLARESHTVQAVGTCREAYSAVANVTANPFQVLISDLGLPDGSGLEVVRRIKIKNPATKAIALSGYGSEEDIQKSIHSGFDAHLTKPIALENLRHELARLFRLDGRGA